MSPHRPRADLNLDHYLASRSLHHFNCSRLLPVRKLQALLVQQLLRSHRKTSKPSELMDRVDWVVGSRIVRKPSTVSNGLSTPSIVDSPAPIASNSALGRGELHELSRGYDVVRRVSALVFFFEFAGITT